MFDLFVALALKGLKPKWKDLAAPNLPKNHFFTKLYSRILWTYVFRTLLTLKFHKSFRTWLEGCISLFYMIGCINLNVLYSINVYRKEELERYKEEQKKPVAPDSDVLKMLQNTHLDQKSPTNTGSFSRLQHQLDNEGKVNTSILSLLP